MTCAPKYRVLYRTSSRGDLFEIETTYIWDVVDEAGTVVRTYTEESSGTLRGGAWQMDDSTSTEIGWVELTEDGRSVRVLRGGVATIEPLP